MLPEAAVAIAIILLLLYLINVNDGMQRVPDAVLKALPQSWTEASILETAHNIKKQPFDIVPQLPPAQDRRYIIVGGSGLVGGVIVSHLLARGQDAGSIRVLDLQRPVLTDPFDAESAAITFLPVDISKAESVAAAFNQPWSPMIASKPLTVFHTAALIQPSERSSLLLSLCTKVNIEGTSTVLAAAKSAGADIFVATASASIDLRPTQFWIPLSRREPKGIVQQLQDADERSPLRDHSRYFSNYAYTKAVAEQLVLQSHSRTFRTGCVRPTAVYGSKRDLLLGLFMKQGTVQTWFPRMSISCVHAVNVSLAHLLYERALLRTDPLAGGRSFIITDAGPPVQYRDIFKLLRVLVPGFRIVTLPPVMMLVLAHCIELYCLSRVKWSIVRSFLPDLPPLVKMLQPAALCSCNIHQIAAGQGATCSIEEGGLGYRGVCTTLEGMCQQVLVTGHPRE